MAKLPAFISHNNNLAALSATTLTTTSSDATYPISNIKELPIAKAWRSEISTVDIKLDFGSAKTIGILALINHNLTSAATITVDGGTTTAYSGFSTTMTWRQYNAFVLLSPTQSFRHWRIRIDDSGPGPDNPVEVGYLVAGNHTTLSSAFSYGWTQTDEYINREISSEFGVPYISELYYCMRFKFTFTNKSASEITAVRNVFKDVKRNVTPLFFIPDTTTSDGYFGRFVSDFERKTDYWISVATLEFLEDSRGKQIAS